MIEKESQNKADSNGARSVLELSAGSKSHDPLAIGVFCVALALLIVASVFFIKKAKTFLHQKGPSDIVKIIDNKSEQIKERIEEKVRVIPREQQIPQPKKKVPPTKSLKIKAKLPRTITDKELVEFVQKENKLRILDMTGCSLITDISPLSKLSHLESLDIENCKQISNLEPLSGLKHLKKLKMSNSTSIRDISPLMKLGSLTELSMSVTMTNEQLVQLTAKLPELRSLVLRRCKFINDISPVSQLRYLMGFYISECRDLHDISPLAKLSGLKYVAVTFSAVTDLSPLSELTDLNSLMLWGSTRLTDLSPISHLKNLRSLGLNGCQGIEDLTPLSGLTQLSNLGLANMKQLTDLSPLYGLTGLKRLDLINSKNISTQQLNEVRKALPNCSITGPGYFTPRAG